MSTSASTSAYVQRARCAGIAVERGGQLLAHDDTVDRRHQIEGRAEHVGVGAARDRFGHGNRRAAEERAEQPELARHVVRGRRQRRARRPAQDEHVRAARARGTPRSSGPVVMRSTSIGAPASRPSRVHPRPRDVRGRRAALPRSAVLHSSEPRVGSEQSHEPSTTQAQPATRPPRPQSTTEQGDHHVARPSTSGVVPRIADYAVGPVLIVIALAVGGSGQGGRRRCRRRRHRARRQHARPSTRSASRRCCRSPCTRPATTSPPRCCSISPFALNFHSSDTGLTAVYIVAGIAVLAVSLITNYQYSDKREWSRKLPAAA